MVIWEHVLVGWSYLDFNNTQSTYLVQSDTFCFFIISGFVTSIQLYEAPFFSTESGTVVLKSRGTFQWKSFIFTRLIGLLPMYWCVLLMIIPWWKVYEDDFAQTFTNVDTNTKNWCRFSLVVAEQTWLPKDKCWASHSYFFTSAIMNCFIMYAIIRKALSLLQDKLMTWRNQNLDSQMSKLLVSDVHNTESKNWIEFIGNCVTKLSYNQSDFKLVLAAASIGFVFLSAMEIIIINVNLKSSQQPHFFMVHFLFNG